MNSKTADKPNSLQKALYGVRKLESGGRPKYRVDWDIVERMAQTHMTIEEICSVMGVDDNVLAAECLKDNSIPLGKFVEAMKQGGKMGLRRQLYKMAVEENNVTAAIHLSKHWLGMHDRKEVSVEASHTLHLQALQSLLTKDDAGAEKMIDITPVEEVLDEEEA